MKAFEITIKGFVQGVGFRPFVYKLAKENDIKGYVINKGFDVFIYAITDNVELFVKRINSKKPQISYISSIEIVESKNFEYFDDFYIKESERIETNEGFILFDIAICEDCLREILDENNRRFYYPFTNCTNCGPRFTIIEKMPYDRKNTTMKSFKMCEKCEKEYKGREDRRFHAQPNACFECGPNVYLYDKDKNLISFSKEALFKIKELLREEKIIAVKGIGGFHLLANAFSFKALENLRNRKKRFEKPFAVMFKDLTSLEKFLEVSDKEKELLLSLSRPIVLLKKKKEINPLIAPDLDLIGAFLPYSPLHYLILHDLDFPVVATSANLSDEPIVKDNEEAFLKLKNIADYIMIHNRYIVRRCDDSVVRLIADDISMIRRARGFAPAPFFINKKLKRNVLAVGPNLKNSFAIGFKDKIILSSHVGDIENFSTLKAFEESIKDFLTLYNFKPDLIIYDLHPLYETTKWALSQKEEKIGIQHHFAHILSVMAENKLEEEVLGIAWDGTGYGTDGTLWGGEFLISSLKSFERAFYFKPFKLLGGEKAIKEPFRVLSSILFDIFGEKALELNIPNLNRYYSLYKSSLNYPYSSSVGRIFDAVGALLGIKEKVNYEGQIGLIMESFYDKNVIDSYDFHIKGKEIDYSPMFVSMLDDFFNKKDKSLIITKFINTLSEIALFIGKNLCIKDVCLSG